MKDLINLLWFIIVVNLVIGIAIDLHYNLDNYDLTKTEEYIEKNQELQKFYENLDIENQQRELSTDTSPPINVWGIGKNVFKIIGNGIAFPFLSFKSEISTLLELLILYALKIWVSLTWIIFFIAIFNAVYIKKTKLG